RRGVQDRHARGLRAPAAGLHARRLDPLYARGRSGRAVAARGRDHCGLAARPAVVPQLRSRDLGTADRGGSPAKGRTGVAQTLTSVSEIERKLAALRLDDERGGARQRTSVMTHIAWVPEEWVEAAEDVLTGLADRHPSRTIVLFPQSGEGGLGGEGGGESFGRGAGRWVCTDTIRITLHGTSAAHPASVVEPLLIPDLPVFLRWRGLPPFGDSLFRGRVE